MSKYTASQISELEANLTLSEGEIEFAKELFANAASARFERSKYPITSDGSEYQGFAKIGEWLLTGTLRKNKTFTTELGSWNYLVLDFSQATEETGTAIQQRMDELAKHAEWFEAEMDRE